MPGVHKFHNPVCCQDCQDGNEAQHDAAINVGNLTSLKNIQTIMSKSLKTIGIQKEFRVTLDSCYV